MGLLFEVGKQAGLFHICYLAFTCWPSTVCKEPSPVWKHYGNSQGSFIKLVLNFPLPCDLFLGNI